MDIPLIHDDSIVFKINLSMSSLIISCKYNAPEQINYQWAVNDFLNRLEKLKNFIVDTNSLVVLTGNINFTEFSWPNMTSTKDYEKLILDLFIENNHSNVAPSQLEIVLTCTYDRSLYKNFSVNSKPCSDHFANCTQINLLFVATLIQAIEKIASNNTDRKVFNYKLTIDPFTCFCYSNIDCLLEQFYTWLRNKIRENMRLVTKHRASLQPWISNGTYNMINKLKIKKGVAKSNLSFKLNIIKLEIEVCKAVDKDLSVYEAEFFESRQFSKIQKYHLSLCKNPKVPPKMFWKGMELTTDKQKAESFNFFFASVFNQKTETPTTCKKQNLNFIKFDSTKIENLLKDLNYTSLLDQIEMEIYC